MKVFSNIDVKGNKVYNEKKRIKHKKDVKFGRTNNAIAKHVGEYDHRIDWEKIICLEKEKRLYSSKILESAYIKENRRRCMNLNDGLGISIFYGKGHG